jgi:hypothetical protein
MRLTVKCADGLKLPRGKADHIEFDDDLAGFGLRIREGGSKTWIYQYRIGSKQRRMVLGSAKSVPLRLARENAGKLEAKVRLGGDPAMDRDAARRDADNTFGALVERYLVARKSEWRSRSEAEIRRHLTVHAKALHRLPITAVSQRNVADVLSKLATEAGNVPATGKSLCVPGLDHPRRHTAARGECRFLHPQASGAIPRPGAERRGTENNMGGLRG